LRLVDATRRLKLLKAAGDKEGAGLDVEDLFASRTAISAPRLDLAAEPLKGTLNARLHLRDRTAQLGMGRRLRAQREEALRDAEELSGAIDLAAERERRAAEQEAESRRLRHAEAAADVAGRRLEAAEEVDAALAGLAAAVEGYEALGRGLAAELRGAGREDGNRIARNVSPFLRWAVHRNALRCAELMGVPRP